MQVASMIMVFMVRSWYTISSNRFSFLGWYFWARWQPKVGRLHQQNVRHLKCFTLWPNFPIVSIIQPWNNEHHKSLAKLEHINAGCTQWTRSSVLLFRCAKCLREYNLMALSTGNERNEKVQWTQEHRNTESNC